MDQYMRNNLRSYLNSECVGLFIEEFNSENTSRSMIRKNLQYRYVFKSYIHVCNNVLEVGYI